MERSYDPRTGRPLEGGWEAIETLTDEELDVELFVAAAATGKKRLGRLTLLTHELERRRFLQQLVDVTS
jgi:hypothetical protein